jgi:hypothetical protein
MPRVQVLDEESLAAEIGFSGDAGEVDVAEIDRIFRESFYRLFGIARDAAHQRLHQAADALRERRAEQAAVLRADLEADLADRLQEIDEEERRARGLLEAETGQRRLFASDDTRGESFEARRAAARAQAEARRSEIAEFERVAEPGPPRALGAVFLIRFGQRIR